MLAGSACVVYSIEGHRLTAMNRCTHAYPQRGAKGDGWMTVPNQPCPALGFKLSLPAPACPALLRDEAISSTQILS